MYALRIQNTSESGPRKSCYQQGFIDQLVKYRTGIVELMG